MNFECGVKFHAENWVECNCSGLGGEKNRCSGWGLDQNVICFCGGRVFEMMARDGEGVSEGDLEGFEWFSLA